MGTMTFGKQCDRQLSFRIMDKARDAGVDFFDTAEIYPVTVTAETIGHTESIVGDWLACHPRESVILASKVAGAGHGWWNAPLRGNKCALDRVHLRKALEGSLRRLKTDYIDLYQVHWPDHGMRAEETLAVLDEFVKEGKVRAVGTSNENSYGLMKSLWSSEREGLVRYETIQNNFSFNNRRFEDEIAEVCRREQVSLLPYSPLAGGVLSGKYNGGGFPEGSRFALYRAEGERQRIMTRRFINEKSLRSTMRFMDVAERAGIDPVTLATAWSKQHDFVASTIVGATTEAQLDPILAAADMTIDAEIMDQLDGVSEDVPYPMG